MPEEDPWTADSSDSPSEGGSGGGGGGGGTAPELILNPEIFKPAAAGIPAGAIVAS